MARVLSLVLALALASLAPALAADPPPFMLENADDPVLVVETSKGEFVVELFAREAPKTVANFVGLALGTKEFKDPRTGEMVQRPYYDGLALHRVIRDFMIQGGCPLGTGTGGPGYTFEDEINAKGLGLDALKAADISHPAGPKPHPWLLIQSQQDFQRLILAPVFEQLGIRTNEQAQARQADIQAAVGRLTIQDVYAKMGYRYDDTLTSRKPTKGTLAMANAGPNTNGSQFFVNLVDNDYLTGRHTVFGKVVRGMDVVESIGAVAVGEGGRPIEPVTIRKVRAWKAD